MSSGAGLLPEPHRGLGSGAGPESETAGARLTRKEVKRLAVDQLGFFRHFASRALEEVPDILRSDERILTMATSNVVTTRSPGPQIRRRPLIVATDRRLLLIDNDLREPPHCDDLSYQGLTLIDVGTKGKDFGLSFRSGDRTFSFDVLPSARGPDLAYLLGAQLDPDRVSVDPPKHWVKGLFVVLPAAFVFVLCLLLDLVLPSGVVLIVLAVAVTLNALRQRRRRRR